MCLLFIFLLINVTDSSQYFVSFVESNFLLILQINGIIQKSCFQTFPNIFYYKKWGTKHFWDKKSPKKLSAVPQPHTEPSKTERDVNYCGYHCIGAFYWLQINTFTSFIKWMHFTWFVLFLQQCQGIFLAWDNAASLKATQRQISSHSLVLCTLDSLNIPIYQK